jgi:SAM-dependent methyltransferase
VHPSGYNGDLSNAARQQQVQRRNQLISGVFSDGHTTVATPFLEHPPMALEALRKGARRFTWELLPPAARRFVKFTWAGVGGRIKPRWPHVEPFGASTAAGLHDQLRAQLEKVNVNVPTELCRIMTRHGSDKGAGWHNYTTVYDHLFTNLRGKQVSLFELGIGTNNPTLASSMGVDGKPGASLRGWAEYFRSGKIFGADIDQDILFNEGRIKTFHCDQLRKSAIEEMWTSSPLSDQFEIVIEDGLHTFEANVSFLENSLHKVRKGGYYIIEDIKQGDLPRWRDRLRNHYSVIHSDFSFCLVRLPSKSNDSDNALLVGRRH